MTKVIRIFMAGIFAMTASVAWAKDAPDVQLKKSLQGIVAKTQALPERERTQHLLGFFKNLQHTDIREQRGFGRLSNQEKQAVTQTMDNVRTLAANYEQALRANPDLDPVMVAQAFADDSEQAGIFLIIGLLAAGALIAFAGIAIALDNAFDNACSTWGCY